MGKEIDVNMAIIAYYVHSAKTWLNNCQGKNKLNTDCIKQAAKDLDTLQDLVDIITDESTIFEEAIVDGLANEDIDNKRLN